MNEASMKSDLSLRPAIAPNRLDALDIARLCESSIENGAGFTHLAGFTTIAAPGDHQLVFLDRFSKDAAEAIENAHVTSALFALPPEYRGHVNKPTIFTEHPREIFARLAIEMFDYFSAYWWGFEDAAAAGARRGGTIVYPGAQIHQDAVIGEGSIIFPGSVIGPNVIIGRRALIKPNSVIGIVSFGIFRGRDNRNTHLPHVGGVVMGDDVEVGALTTVCAGTIHPTIVADTVKVDDHVHVGHNTQTGEGTLICANSVIAGSAVLGRDVWISPNTSIIESTNIGDKAFVGLAANVLKDVPANTVVVGNPARPLRTLPPLD
jgi:acetyltransferase-like isoleucine patch superfamily enzyme